MAASRHGKFNASTPSEFLTHCHCAPSVLLVDPIESVPDLAGSVFLAYKWFRTGLLGRACKNGGCFPPSGMAYAPTSSKDCEEHVEKRYNSSHSGDEEVVLWRG